MAPVGEPSQKIDPPPARVPPPAAAPSAAGVDAQNTPTHGALCTLCKANIVGVRYRCISCANVGTSPVDWHKHKPPRAQRLTLHSDLSVYSPTCRRPHCTARSYVINGLNNDSTWSPDLCQTCRDGTDALHSRKFGRHLLLHIPDTSAVSDTLAMNPTKAQWRHEGWACGDCKATPIVGVRYYCTPCSLSLCAACMLKKAHPSTHPLVVHMEPPPP